MKLLGRSEGYVSADGNKKTIDILKETLTSDNSDLKTDKIFSEDPKKILILISSIGGGGAERVASILANGLSKRYEVSVMYYNRKEAAYHFNEEVRLIDCSSTKSLKSDIPGVYRIRSILRTMNRVRKINEFVRKEKTDVVISLLISPNFYNGLSRVKALRICSERNDPSRNTKKYQKRGLFAYRHCDHVVFQSREVMEQFPKDIQEKSYLIPNPVQVDTRVSEIRKKKIVSIGRLVSQKRFDILIRAFKDFHETHPDHHLHIYGKGELKKDLKELTRQLNISDSVHFEGFHEDIHEEIRDAECFVLSSDYEGMSNALLEAMAMGHACISTDCAGSTDLIEDGVNGILVKRGDISALSKAMTMISDDPELRERLGKKAMESMEDLSPERIVREWEKIWK